MTNVDRIAKLKSISVTEAIGFWKQVSTASEMELSTYEVLTALLAQGECVASVSAVQLAEQRKSLEAKKTKNQEKFLANEAAGLKEIADQRAEQQKTTAIQNPEEDEFRQLVAEMSAHGFTHSRQVSAYIVRNRLGYKYRHISGILKMEMDGNVWSFKGGFPPKIYARLCEELQLGNNGSRAIAREFTPYNDIL